MVTFTIFGAARDTSAKPHEAPWDEWSGAFLAHDHRDQKDGPCVVLGEIPAGEPHRNANVRSVHALAIDVEKRTVTVAGQAVDLTAKEFDLLLQFAAHPGRVYSRQQLLDLVWGTGHMGYEHTVNSHINRLRGKIEDNPAEPEYVLTVWGVGYKFNDQLAVG